MENTFYLEIITPDRQLHRTGNQFDYACTRRQSIREYHLSKAALARAMARLKATR